MNNKMKNTDITVFFRVSTMSPQKNSVGTLSSNVLILL